MSVTIRATLLYWYGDKVGVRINRCYYINMRNQFKDFFGDTRAASQGVWRLVSGEICTSVKLDNITDEYVRQLVKTAEEHGSLQREFFNRSKPSLSKGRQNKLLSYLANYGTSQLVGQKVVVSLDFAKLEERVQSQCKTCVDGICTNRCQ